MWLLFIFTILLTREVVANFEIDIYDVDKSIKRDIFNIIARQAQTKKLAEKMSNEEQTSPFKNEYENTSEGNKIVEEMEKRRKRSIDEINFEESMKSGLEKRNTPISSWFFWPEKKDPITVEERSGKSNQQKKNPRFSPWGGKRIDSYLSNPEFRQTVHVFNRWGGKRGNEISGHLPQENNRKLYSWNRFSPNDNIELKRVSKSNFERKVPFNSWGGKRSIDDSDFTPTILDDQHQFEEKIGFRNRKDQYRKSQENLVRKMDERRMPLLQKFESWGGKRTLTQVEPGNLELSNGNFMETIRSRIPKKRSNRALRHRLVFQPWGGKRNRETPPENRNIDTRMPPASYLVRKIFFPWGG